MEKVTIICSVARSGARPILFLPGSAKAGYGAGLPKGDVAMRLEHAGGRAVVASVAKVAINVAREVAGGPNVLGDILIGWFGDDAGAPKTARCKVAISRTGAQWIMAPVRADSAAVAA
jgi:hypothetical protein